MDPLVAHARTWILDPTASDRINFYSAEEEVNTEGLTSGPTAANGPSLGASAKAGPGFGGGGPSVKPAEKKKPRPTVASLASTVDEISKILPMLTSQLEVLEQRTAAMSQNPGAQGTPAKSPLLPTSSGGVAPTLTERSSILKQPLSAAVVPEVSGVSAMDLVQRMPPPRGPPNKAAAMSAGIAQQEARELQIERQLEDPSSSSDLAKAVLAQSTALTALVGQLAAGGDGMADLSSTLTSGLSTKGAAGRARLQQELAMHKGNFFKSVLQSMSRRMHPSFSAELEPEALMARGVTATAYMERFGGYGKTRDIGQIAWQVALVMDHLQQGNVPAAQDAVALLSVCLEQTAMDSGKMDVALLLSLTEDPPASIYSSRSLATSSRARAFAPTAEQRWVTTALSYIRELDLIMSRRSEAVGGVVVRENPKKESPLGGGDVYTPKPKAKKKSKAQWKKYQGAEGEEDQ